MCLREVKLITFLTNLFILIRTPINYPHACPCENKKKEQIQRLFAVGNPDEIILDRSRDFVEWMSESQTSDGLA